jgi:hypothetical protein
MSKMGIVELSEENTRIDDRLAVNAHDKLEWEFRKKFPKYTTWSECLNDYHEGYGFGIEQSQSGGWNVWWFYRKNFYLSVRSHSLEHAIYAIYIKKHYTSVYCKNLDYETDKNNDEELNPPR